MKAKSRATIVGLPLRFWILTAFVSGSILWLRFGLHTTDRFGADVGAISAYITAIGTLYGMLATFTIYVVWTQFNDTQSAVDTETNDLVDLFRYCVYLRDPAALEQLESSIRAYCQSVVRNEWAAMSSGTSSRESVQAFEGIFAAVHSIHFDDERDAHAWAEMIRKFESVSSARTKRLDLALSKVPGLLRGLLYLVSVSLIIGFLLLSVNQDFLALVVTLATTSVVLLAIEVVVDLDDPFGGQWTIAPGAFEGLEEQLASVKEASGVGAIGP